jgi:hypothetical protein
VVYEQITGLLGSPCAVRVGGYAEDVYVPGRYLHDEQHVQAPEEDRVDMEEIAGEQSVRLSAEERPPRSINTATSWRSTMIPASLDAWLRPSSTSQPKTRIMIR